MSSPITSSWVRVSQEQQVKAAELKDKPSVNIEELLVEEESSNKSALPSCHDNSSPSKRRLHSGTMPSPKKSKSKDQCSKEAPMIGQFIEHKIEEIANRIRDQGIKSAAAHVTLKSLHLDLNEMKKLFETSSDDEEPELALVDKKWEIAMLHGKRYVVRVARDGSDEVITTAPFAEACYVHLAKEILHRIRDTNPESGFDVELMSDFNLDFLMKIRGEHLSSPTDRDAFEAAVWYVSRSLLIDREETFRCLGAHPYYNQKGREIQRAIKQELIDFFDRRFTFQMCRLYGIDVPFHGALLRLEGDFALYQEDQVDCGVFGDATIENAQTWATLIKPTSSMTQEKRYNVASGVEAFVAKKGLESDELEFSGMEDITRRADDISLA